MARASAVFRTTRKTALSILGRIRTSSFLSWMGLGEFPDSGPLGPLGRIGGDLMRRGVALAVSGEGKLLDEHGAADGLALVHDRPYPVRVARPAARAGFAADDNPPDAV